MAARWPHGAGFRCRPGDECAGEVEGGFAAAGAVPGAGVGGAGPERVEPSRPAGIGILRRRLIHQRPYTVAESLGLLRGPSSGTVRCRRTWTWPGNAVYDLDAPGRIVGLYRAVLIEAATPQDLSAYLDAGALRRLWSLPWLPPRLRKAWEQKFPVGAETSRLAPAA